MHSGQVCTAIKRLYVHENVYAPIVDGLVERAKAVTVGDGLDAATQLGPTNNKMQFDKVVALVDDAKQHGGRIAAGGAALDRPGYFYPLSRKPTARTTGSAARCGQATWSAVRNSSSSSNPARAG